MSKKEIARLRKHALYTGAVDPIVDAFDAAHVDNNRKARVTRKKGEAKVKAAKSPKVKKAAPVEEPLDTAALDAYGMEEPAIAAATVSAVIESLPPTATGEEIHAALQEVPVVPVPDHVAPAELGETWDVAMLTSLLTALVNQMPASVGFIPGPKPPRVRSDRAKTRWIAAFWKGESNGQPVTLELGFWRESKATGFPLAAYAGLAGVDAPTVAADVTPIKRPTVTYLAVPVVEDAKADLQHVSEALAQGLAKSA